MTRAVPSCKVRTTCTSDFVSHLKFLYPNAAREMFELIVISVGAGARAGAVDEYELRHAKFLRSVYGKF